jgi:hypothetical protein
MFILAGAIIAFIVAPIHIWTAEHHARLDAEQKSQPRLVARIDDLNIGDAPPNAAGKKSEARLLLLVVDIRNLGAPSIVDGPEFRLDLPEFANCKFLYEAIPENGVRTEGPRPRSFPRNSALYYKATTTPIPTGGKVVGALFFSTQCVDRETLFRDRSHLKLTLQDVTGKEVVVENIAKEVTAGDVIFPGLTPP